MLQHADIFVRKLMKAPNYNNTADGSSPPCNMTACSRHLQYDVMGEFGFGQSLELQTKPDNHFLIDAVTATTHKAGAYVQYPKLQYLQLDKLLYRRGIWMRKKYLQLMSRPVGERLSQRKTPKTTSFPFLSMQKIQNLARDSLRVGYGLRVGADTSSTGLTAAIFYLTAYPECYAKLISEIRTTFTLGSEIRTGPKLASCHYLRACIDEMMHMSPPISSTLLREVCPGGIDLDNNHIPQGCDIGVNPYAVHHNEELYPEYYTSKPKWWIASDDNPKEAVERVIFAFSPFSLGTRACAGRKMAYIELMDTLARTLWYTDFKRAEGPLGQISAREEGAWEGRHRVNEFQLEEHITCHHNGPYVQFREGKRFGEEFFKL